MGSAISCCYKCPNRFVGCHSQCTTYQAQVVQNEIRKEEERKLKEAYYAGVTRWTPAQRRARLK